MPISPLLDADQPEHSRLSRRSFVSWDTAIVESFVHDNQDRDKADRGHGGYDPKSQLPCMFPDDECCRKGA